MSDEALSQNQVENLLKAMESATAEESAAEKAAEPEETVASAPVAQPAAAAPPKRKPKPKPTGKPYSHGVAAGARVTAYDFKRPERVGKDQMRAMQSLHESIARNFGASISGLLRTMLEVKLLSVDQLTYSEFVFSLDNPSCFNVIKPMPLEGHWVLDIAPSLAYAIIDRMLGGDPAPGDTIRRPLTEIETRLMCRVVELFLNQIIPAWENIVPLQPKIESTESNPQLAQIVPPNEVAILVSFEVLLGKNRGMMNLCIPFNTIEKYNSKLSRNGWVGYGKTFPTEKSKKRIVDNIDSAPVDVVVTLARSRIKTSDLLDLTVGDIITTEKLADAPLEVSIQSVPKFKAAPGAFRGKKAVQIQNHIEPKRVEADEEEDDLAAHNPPKSNQGETTDPQTEAAIEAAEAILKGAKQTAAT